ncbi:hypothetical protein BKA67DRAFT_655121 [Truncatella angustata]|uniref:Uncharacterized protein n=1 Tax=Truncatella angustata TaxID=152316 RepID=A0A9P8URC3_9PEZI|nr:uncharacterized protein BKA67DRAFT_655121 [Truncatella angustata]KAH6656814.1 hypothetical protein BKA67DRAFT_655121 [Truncatella angustata]
MSAYYQYNHQPTSAAPSVPHNNHHGGRNRRAPRLSVSQNSHRQFRGVRSMKELSESVAVTSFRTQFETSRSFDLEDDMEFCPKLLTESDLVSISSSGSDRSSLSSNSPHSSPTQHPQQVAPAFSLNSSSPAFIPPTYHTQQSTLKLHQPAATRTRNAIPIINPANGLTLSSPPPSVSPARMQQPLGRRW